jgi:hypothetical protein
MVVVVPRRGIGARLVAAPGWPVAVVELGQRAVGVGIVAQGENGAGDAVRSSAVAWSLITAVAMSPAPTRTTGSAATALSGLPSALGPRRLSHRRRRRIHQHDRAGNARTSSRARHGRVPMKANPARPPCRRSSRVGPPAAIVFLSLVVSSFLSSVVAGPRESVKGQRRARRFERCGGVATPRKLVRATSDEGVHLLASTTTT